MCGGDEKNTDSDDESRKYGEPMQYDPDFNGPIKNRSCTDIICFVIFIVFLLAWIVISALAFKFGNPEKLVYPTDSFGNICGEGDFGDRPFLYFFDLSKCVNLPAVVTGCPTPQVCVKQCPNETFMASTLPLYGQKYADVEKKLAGKLVCQYEFDKLWTIERLVKEEKCAGVTLESDPLMGRCIPFTKAFTEIFKKNETLQTELKDGATAVTKILNLKSVGEELFADFKKIWPIIVVAFVLVMVLSLVWIVIMRWVAWIMVWLSIFLVIALLSVACWYTFSRYVHLKNNPDVPEESELIIKRSTLDSYAANKSTWLTLGIISAVVLVILLLVIICLRNRIRLATALIQESSKAVGNIMSSLFFPIVPFVLQLAVIGLWLAVALHLSSANFPQNFAVVPDSCKDVPECSEYKKLGTFCELEKFNKTCQQKCPQADCYFMQYQQSSVVTWAQVFNLFGLFWGVFFVAGLGEMVLAGAFATWYWTFEKSNVPTFALTQSFGRTLRYHLGSLAFGSLLVAIVRMIRVFLEYVDRKLKEYQDNIATKALMCCLKCCFWCLEKFIKFINRNAYIMISIYGKNFCVSAKNAFFLLMRNIARVVVLDKVTDFLLFLGKLTIVAGIGVLSFAFFSGRIHWSFIQNRTPTLNYNLVPVIVIILGSYLITSCFFSVYSMAVDTLFLCFLEDCEVNDGSPEKPYRMSKKLMKILGKKNNLEDPDESAAGKLNRK